MKVKATLAAVAAGLLLTAGSCQSTESDECEWELDDVAYVTSVRPKPQRVTRVPGAKPPVRMPAVKPPKPRTAPHGKVWEYGCD